MRNFVAYLVIGFTCLVSAAQSDSGMKSLEHALNSGGKVNLSLESGSYIIQPSDSEHIVVRWEQRGDVTVTLDTKDGTATLRTTNTSNKDIHAEIEVPRKSDLWIRLTAGNLEVGPIRGDKDIESRAGNIKIAIVDPQDYSHVDASLYAGNLDASPFGVQKGGLFRSFHWRGSGRYRLHVHLLAGDLNLHGSATKESGRGPK